MQGVALGVSVLIAVLALVKLEAMVATDVLLIRKGDELAEWLESCTPEDRANAEIMWDDIYSEIGAAKLPWFPVGIKSYRMYAAIERRKRLGHRRSAALLSIVRQLWRIYFFAPGLAIYSLIMVFLIKHPSLPLKIILFATVECLVLCTIALAVESLVASHRLGGWADAYHNWPAIPDYPVNTKNTQVLRELTLYLACVGLGYCLLVALQVIAIQGFQSNSTAGFTLGTLNTIALHTFSSIAQGSGTVANTIALNVATWTVLIFWLAYVGVIVAIAAISRAQRNG